MDIEFITEVMGTPGLSTWLTIMSWAFVLGWIFTFTRMLRGGFDEFTEIADSPYATAREKWDARIAMPGRFFGIIIASGVGTAGVAIGLFVQGAILIFIFQNVLA